MVVAAAADEVTQSYSNQPRLLRRVSYRSIILRRLGFQPIGNANVHVFVQRYLAESGHSGAHLAAPELRYLQAALN
jgi:hypothetical protein